MLAITEHQGFGISQQFSVRVTVLGVSRDWSQLGTFTAGRDPTHGVIVLWHLLLWINFLLLSVKTQIGQGRHSARQ